MNKTIEILELELKQTKEVMGEEAVRYIEKLQSHGHDGEYDLSFYMELKVRCEVIQYLINKLINEIFPE